MAVAATPASLDAPASRVPRLLAAGAVAFIAVSDTAALWFYAHTPDNSIPLLAFFLCETLIAPAVGFLIVRRHPRHPVGWLLIAHGVLNCSLGGDGYTEYSVVHSAGLPGAALQAQISQATWPTLYLCMALVAYVFPDGHFLSRRWRRFVGIFLVGYLVFMVTATFDLEKFDGRLAVLKPPLPKLPELVVGPPGFTGLALIAASLVGAVVCARARLKRSAGEERVQMLWFTWAALSIPLGLAACWLDYFVIRSDGTVTIVGVMVSGSVLPIAIGIAILRTRLFDIELVLSRTLTYSALTALVVGLYAGVLAGLGALVDNRTAAGLVAVGAVAVLIQPVHSRLRRRVERWVYGDRSDPYSALRRLSDRLDGSGDPAQVVEIVTTSVAEALRVDRVSVELGEQAVPTPYDGGDRRAVVRAPLVHQGRRLGDLVVEVPPGRQLSAADRQLLDGLARHAAIVVNAVHLTLDLQRSRARLVTAQEEERRRLRRDLHDGVGPSLAAIVLKLNVLGATVDDPSSTELIGELRAETKGAIAEIRRLVDDLRPPALDEVGLVGALRQKAVSLSGHGDPPLVVEVEGPTGMPPLPAAVEVAAYRIAMEAMTNVARHSGAFRCTVTVAVNGAVEVTVVDNGTGPRDGATPGVGWGSMRDRAAELGGSCSVSRRHDGGTMVRAIIPLPSAIPMQSREPEPAES